MQSPVMLNLNQNISMAIERKLHSLGPLFRVCLKFDFDDDAGPLPEVPKYKRGQGLRRSMTLSRLYCGDVLGIDSGSLSPFAHQICTGVVYFYLFITLNF